MTHHPDFINFYEKIADTDVGQRHYVLMSRPSEPGTYAIENEFIGVIVETNGEKSLEKKEVHKRIQRAFSHDLPDKVRFKDKLCKPQVFAQSAASDSKPGAVVKIADSKPERYDWYSARDLNLADEFIQRGMWWEQREQGRRCHVCDEFITRQGPGGGTVYTGPATTPGVRHKDGEALCVPCACNIADLIYPYSAETISYYDLNSDYAPETE